MKFKVFDKKQKPQETFINLEERPDGIAIVAVDSRGYLIPGGNIAKILNDGRLIRFGGIAEGLGFQLDNQGMIEVL